MKIAVGVMLVIALLAGSAYAAKPDASSDPSLNKELVVQASPLATKKNKTSPSKKVDSSDQAGTFEVDPKAKKQLDNVTETPPESAESVKLKGVRG